MRVVAPLKWVYSLSWPKELAKAQVTFFYQEMQSPFGQGGGSGGNLLSPELAAALEGMAKSEGE